MYVREDVEGVPDGEEEKEMDEQNKCNCGSGEYREAVYDRQGIFVTYACPECKTEKLGGYRSEIIDGPYNPGRCG